MRVAGIVVAGLTLAGRLLAQAPVAEGDRIRVTAESYRIDARIGTVRSVSNDRLVFRPADSTESVELNYRAIQALDKSVGKKAGIVPGLIYGGLAGVLAGGILGTTCDGGVGDSCGSTWLLRGTGAGIALGLVAGFTILRTDRWVRITLPGARPGVGVGAGFSF